MKLDNIKNQTTWSDASASINKNFGKISNAIRQGLPVINTPVDDELSDESDNAIANRAVANALKEKQDALVSGENIKTVNGQSLLGKGNIEIQGGTGGGGSVDPELLEAYMPMAREFSDDFNNDFSR